MRIKKSAATLVLTAASLVAMAGSALAYAGSSGGFQLGTTGVQFQNGYYTFLNYEANDFYYQGDLKDTARDGNSVFVHAKIDAYGYSQRLYVTCGSGCSVFKSQYLNSYDITKASNARVEACQDRGTLYSDLCDSAYFVNYVK